MSDKRAVSTDALETLGNIINEGNRDAIHLAVEPCIAGERLHPGQHIGIVDGFATSKAEKKLGIVDPFLSVNVLEGEMFWLVVYPRTITSLRHVWSHPDFEDKTPEQDVTKMASEKWLRDWCEMNDTPDYEIVVKAILGLPINDELSESYGSAYRDEGEYITFVGRDAHCSIPWEFWQHFETVHGKVGSRPAHFSCTC